MKVNGFLTVFIGEVVKVILNIQDYQIRGKTLQKNSILTHKGKDTEMLDPTTASNYVYF